VLSSLRLMSSNLIVTIQNSMTLKYRSSRAEIWRWYWQAWHRPKGLWRFHLLLFAAILLIRILGVSSRGDLTPTYIGMSLVFSFLAIAWMPLWPLILFKSEERVLTLDDLGTTTTIGSKSGTARWQEIARIDSDDQVVSITRTNGNAFLIPNRAFSNSDERAQCLKFIREWHRAAHRTHRPGGRST
jgi:hypothetical protein